MLNLVDHKILKWNKLINFCLILVSAIILTLVTTNLAQAQFALPSGIQTQSQLPEGVRRYGSVEVAAVKSPIDGNKLFEVTSETITDRTNISEAQLPVEVRAQNIKANLERALLGEFHDLNSLKISISTLNNQPIIQVSDENITRPIRLVTVTDIDADLQGKEPQEVAEDWKTILEKELIKSIKLFSPEELRSRIRKALQIIGIAIFLSVLFWFSQRLLYKRLNKLRAKQAQELIEREKADGTSVSSQTSPEEMIAQMRQQFLYKVKSQFSIQKQLGYYSFWRWLLFWLQIIVWYVAAIWICGTLPVLMKYQSWVLSVPLDILVVWFLTSFAIRLSNLIIDRIFNAWKSQEFIPIRKSERKEIRTGTISQAVKGLVNFLLLFWAFTYILNLFGVSTSSIIAGSAVIGFAISLGSQNVIKDLVNGILILVEDQYAVGDVVKIRNAAGLVENLNLRVTQIRNGEGSLVTIPNSSIVEVENLTRNWSKVNFAIEIAYYADIDLALKLLNQVGEEMFHDEQWKGKILELPQVLGVDDINHQGLLIRMSIRTEPLQQWSVGRDLRYRVRKIFADNNIDIGKPQIVNYNSQFPFLDSEQNKRNIS